MPLSAWVTPHYAATSRKTRVLLDSMWPFEFIRLNQRTNVSALDTGNEHWRHIMQSRPRGKGVSAGGELDTIIKLYPRSLEPKDALSQLKIACQPAPAQPNKS